MLDLLFSIIISWLLQSQNITLALPRCSEMRTRVICQEGHYLVVLPYQDLEVVLPVVLPRVVAS